MSISIQQLSAPSPTHKQTRMADGEIWELYYWPKLAGRGEFVRVIFEEAGVKFKEINDLDVLVPMFRHGKVSSFCLSWIWPKPLSLKGGQHGLGINLQNLSFEDSKRQNVSK